MSVPRSGESTGDACRRLKSEGRRGAFLARRKEFEREGRDGTDAYYMALNEFPPLEEGGSLTLDGAPLNLASGSVSSDGSDSVPDLNLGDPDIRRDAYWAYNHIGRKGVVASDAPSQGAWNMFRCFGRNDEATTEFLEKIAKPMLSAEPKGERYSDDNRELIALAERYRAEKVSEMAEEAA